MLHYRAGIAPPSVTVLLPTFNSAALLPTALASLAVQDYAGDVELLVVDGGSTDDSVALALRHGARVVDNPDGHEEAARALGVDEARGELILLLDADNELVGADWLSRLVAALDAGPGVVASDCLHHAWRATDPPVNRLCALIGGTDPLAIELGWGDRWAVHLGRWTGQPILQDTIVGDGVHLVRIDPDRPPSMGSNGFLVRADALRRTDYTPSFVHSDVAGDLAADGGVFARVDMGIVHHYAPTLRRYAQKQRRRARRSLSGVPVQRRGYRPPPWRLALQVLFSASVVGPSLLAVQGYRRHADWAWALYPVLSLITVAAYVGERIALLRPDGQAP